MSDVSIDNGDELSSRSLSRRTALKAGVAAGVGVAAWSGATITSLGGTPAYAVGCTFAAKFDLVTCRNTDQGNSNPKCDERFRYHVLGDTLQSGFSITNNITEGTCCNPGFGVNGTSPPVFNFPPGLYCKVELIIALPPSCSGTVLADVTMGEGNGGSFQIDLPCPGDPGFPTSASSGQYKITASCVTDGKQDCFKTP